MYGFCHLFSVSSQFWWWKTSQKSLKKMFCVPTNFNLDHHNYLNYVVGYLGKMFVIFDKSKYHTLSIYGDQEWYNGEIINVYKPGLAHVLYFLGQERMFLISVD